MRICVYGASSNDIDPTYLQAGEMLGYEMAKRGHSLVFGGGKQGMMGAVARGMKAGGGVIVGVAPKFFDQYGVLYNACTEFIYTETMRERKAIMEEQAEAFIMTPGGIGTFEEFYEILTLRQLRRHNKPIAVLNTWDYYGPLLQMQERAISQRFMKPGCRNLFAMFEDPQRLLQYLESDAARELDINDLRAY